MAFSDDYIFYARFQVSEYRGKWLGISDRGLRIGLAVITQRVSRNPDR
jgi:hypothetical protein